MKMLLSDDSRKMNNKKHEQQQGYGSSEKNILSIMDDMIDEDDDDEEEKERHTPNCLAPFQQQQQQPRDGAVTFYAPFVPLLKLSLSLIVVATIGVVIMTTMSFHNHNHGSPSVSTTRQQQQHEALLSLIGIKTRNGMESTHSIAVLRGDNDDDEDYYSFQEFCLKYNKNYNDDADEYDRRKKIFNKNVQKIMHHNQKKNSSFQLGINQFTDLTADELPLGLDKSAAMRSSIPGIRSFSYELFPGTTIEDEIETDTLLPHKRKLQQLKKKKKKHSKKDGDEKDDSDTNTSDEEDDANDDTDDDAAAIKLIASLPDSVDWRTVILPESKSRVTTPIKNQGQCGSCWAFASMAALESHIALQTGFLFTFSTQELISCAPNQDHCGSVAGGYGGGCNGSTGELAYDFISSGRGVVTEWDWGYTSYAGSRGKCPLHPSPFSTDGDDNDTSTTSTTKSVKKSRKLYSSSDSSSSESDSSDSSSSDSSSSDSSSSDSSSSDSSSDSSSSDSLLDLFSDVFSSVQEDEEEKETTVDLLIPGAVASITGHTQLRTNSYIELLHAVATQGPVVVNVAASEGWLSYHGGIFTDLHEDTRDVNHVVVVEGYGTDPHTHQDFWLVRNSWGPLWGEQGYIRLHRVNPYHPQACTAHANAAKAATAGKKLLDLCGECKMDLTPQDGIACVGPDFSITPKPVMVCGTSGILYDAVLPVGGALL